MQDQLPHRELQRRGVAEQSSVPLPDHDPKAGVSEAELRAAARVIENEVQRVTARHAHKTS